MNHSQKNHGPEDGEAENDDITEHIRTVETCSILTRVLRAVSEHQAQLRSFQVVTKQMPSPGHPSFVIPFARIIYRDVRFLLFRDDER